MDRSQPLGDVFELLKWVLLGMAFTYLWVDCLNGVLIRIGVGLSISQLFKMALLAGMLLYLLWKNTSYFLISFGLILFFLFPLLLRSIFTGDTRGVVGDFGYNLKLILFPISFLFFGSLDNIKGQNLKIRNTFAWSNFALIAVNILLGVAGIGYSQYNGPEGAGIGGRGFFYAGNEVAGIFVLFGGVCWYLTKGWGSIFRFVFFVFLLILGIMNTSKTAILGIILIVGLTELPTLLKKKMSLGQFLIVLMLPFLAFAIVGSVYYGVQATGLIDRISFFYQRMDLLTFILSGRNEMVAGAMSFYTEVFGFWDYLFGLGNGEFVDMMGRYHTKAQIIEIDFFDLLFINGMLGMGLILAIYVAVTCKSMYEGIISNTPYWAINLILILISMMAGHIFNSAMLGISLGFFNGLVVHYPSSKTQSTSILV